MFKCFSFLCWWKVVKVTLSGRKKNQLIRNPFNTLINSLNLTLDRRDLRKLIRGRPHLCSINSITKPEWKDNWKLQGESHVNIIDCSFLRPVILLIHQNSGIMDPSYIFLQLDKRGCSMIGLFFDWLIGLEYLCLVGIGLCCQTRGCVRSWSDSALALSDEGTVGNNEWMDVPLGKVHDATADLIRKAFYSAGEHVAMLQQPFEQTDRRFLCCVGWRGVRVRPTFS